MRRVFLFFAVLALTAAALMSAYHRAAYGDAEHSAECALCMYAYDTAQPLHTAPFLPYESFFARTDLSPVHAVSYAAAPFMYVPRAPPVSVLF